MTIKTKVNTSRQMFFFCQLASDILVVNGTSILYITAYDILVVNGIIDPFFK